MKNLLLIIAIIMVNNGINGMEADYNAAYQSKSEQTNSSHETIELPEIAPSKDVEKKLNLLIKKIDDLEKGQQRERGCKSKLFLAISTTGSIASTVGLLLYLASWYIEF